MSKATGIAALVIIFTAGAILFAFWLTKDPRQFNADAYGFSSSGKDFWTYDDLRSVLETVDNNGLVNYRRLKANRTALDRFTLRLAKLDRKTFDTWGNLEQMSLWINAYNGLTLLAIISLVASTLPAKSRNRGKLRPPTRYSASTANPSCNSSYPGRPVYNW